MAKRRAWLAGIGLAALAAVATRWPAVNDVTTGQTPEYPDLQPRQYPQDPQTVFQAVQTVAKATRGWRVTAVDPATRTLQAEARVLLTPFTDDVTVWVQPADGGSRVEVRSRSRVGRGDLGVNARRIRAFLSSLDRGVDVHHRDRDGNSQG
jgi:uncharacterized protein (DUF1499 family)